MKPRAAITGKSIDVHVVERATRTAAGAIRCEIGLDVAFEMASLETYFFAEWKPEAYDALLVAAAVEFADRSCRRPARDWRRSISIRVPVHDVARWRQPSVETSLRRALEYLTGDSWNVTFYRRSRSVTQPTQSHFELPVDVEAVIPFSNGLDSRAVAGLMEQPMGSRLVRIRLASNLQENEELSGRSPFRRLPYRVRTKGVESSARSRGFKFAVVSGIAAHLSGAKQIIVPESGQGALGPSLVPVGQTYEDYRSHPSFTRLMEDFFAALFDKTIRFSFPQLWRTKGETLRAFIDLGRDPSWRTTRSCWQQSRQVGVSGSRRQCGICAACMLRRMSVHAAGVAEDIDSYVWERLDVASLDEGVASGFSPDRITGKLRDYAIAGTLHLDHLAALSRPFPGGDPVGVYSLQLGDALRLDPTVVMANLRRLIDQHAHEWSAFVASLGPVSFLNNWAMEVRR